MEKFLNVVVVSLSGLAAMTLPQTVLSDPRSEHPAELSSVQPYDSQAIAFADRFTIQPIEPALGYARSAPTAVAADYAAEEYKPFSDNHKLSLALELSNTLTSAQVASLQANGPWLTDEGLSINAQQLIRSIQNAAIHGLDPDSYGLAEILRTVDTLSGLDRSGPQPGQQQRTVHLPGSLSLRDVLTRQMDQAFTSLSLHLGQGVVDARATQRSLFRDAPVINAQELLESVRSGQHSALEALTSVTPTHADYRRLTGRMRNLLTERASGTQRPAIAHHTNASSMLSHADVYAVKSRLVDTGDLTLKGAVTPYFDEELTSALKSFQVRHGLNASGRLDLRTRKVLNLSIEEEIQAIALSLERWRWMPRNLGKKHIFINIPDYRVVVRDADKTLMNMTAVVGSVDHQTPTFSRDMSYMEFNPTWTVPASIANRELVPRERRRPGYLVSRQFDFLKRVGKQLVVVPPEEITAAELNTEPFPYVLRQRGGPINALGRMKFMMPNPYAIYLHDTQAKKHFTLNDRAYSHGCIRLSDPDALAILLMRGDGYSQNTINKTLKGGETKRVRLRTPVPTHLTYMTTWVDESGELQRRSDIYRHDEALTKALREAGTLLSLLKGPDDADATLQRLASNNF